MDEVGPRFPPDDLRVDFGVREIVDPVKMANRMAEIERDDEARRERKARDRETKRLADAIARFAEFGASLPGVWVCFRCHALVEDREHHVRWHDSLDATAAQAASANGRGRLIA